MAKGRISVSTLNEANIVFDKIINYQSNPTTDLSFYKTGVNCAYFQADYTKRTELRRFTLTNEEVRDYLMSKAYNINRVYCTLPDNSPQFYNNDFYATGAPLPEELKRPNFAWEGNNIDIKNNINNGCFYILHRDHGDYEFWDIPRFTVSDITQLTNGQKLPVVFSMNCRTGAFDKPICFSEKFLRHPNGGAVGVFCATASSLSGFNDALTIGVFDAIWYDPGLTVRFGSQGISNPNLNKHEDIYSMGDVLNQGLLRMSQTWSDSGTFWNYKDYTFELFHYLGDPSMEIYTEAPSKFSNITIVQNGTSVTVNTGGIDNCKIVLCSKSDNGESYFSVADGVSSHIFTNVDVPCSICVTKHNYIPYLFNEDVFIQNRTLTGKNVFVGKNIKMGRNVKPDATQGDVTISSGANVIVDAEGDTVLDKGFNCEMGGTLNIK